MDFKHETEIMYWLMQSLTVIIDLMDRMDELHNQLTERFSGFIK